MQMRLALQSAGVYGAVSSETVSCEEDRECCSLFTRACGGRSGSLAGKDVEIWHGNPSRLLASAMIASVRQNSTLEMEDTKSVETFATRVNKIVTSICPFGDEMNELMVVQKIL
jgi:hypothetical protein